MRRLPRLRRRRILLLPRTDRQLEGESMRFRVLMLVVAAAVFAGTAACDENLSDLTGPTPSLQPTFSSIQKEIFDTTDSSGRLACTTCHSSVGRIPSAGLDLTAGGSY